MTCIIKENAKGYDLIPLSDELLCSSRSIFINTDINSDTANDIIQKLIYLDSINNDEIKIYINSPGGSVIDGLAIYDTAMHLSSPITTVCSGIAASMAAILFLVGGKRLIMPHSKVMIHDASFGKADFSRLKPGEISEKAADLLQTTNILRKIIADRTNQSLKTITTKMKKDSYFNAEEAVNFGLATKILQKGEL